MSDSIERPEFRGSPTGRDLVRVNPAKRTLSLPLSLEEKGEYYTAILPRVQTARAAYQPLREIRTSIKVLKGQEEQLSTQIKDSTAPQFALRHPLSSQLEMTRQIRESLENSPETRLAEESFRLAANNFIAHVNTAKAEIVQKQGQVLPTTIGLVGKPQIPRPESFPPTLWRPFSPPKQHTDLGMLAIYREKRLDPTLKSEINRITLAEWPGNQQMVDMALAVTFQLPEHFIRSRGPVPFDFRNPRDVAREVTNLVRLIGSYQMGDPEVQMITQVMELDRPRRDQEPLITQHLRGLLVACLLTELQQPNMQENQILSLYGKLSRNIRELAVLITRDSFTQDSFELVGKLIEGLPNAEGPVLAARLSTNIYKDLYLPCVDYLGEARVAELLRDISMDSFKNRHDPDVVAKNTILLRKLTESLIDRLDHQDTDVTTILKYLESSDYGEFAIEELFEIANDSQQEVLMGAIIQSGCFRGLFRRHNKTEHRRPRAIEDDFEEEFDVHDYMRREYPTRLRW